METTGSTGSSDPTSNLVSLTTPPTQNVFKELWFWSLLLGVLIVFFGVLLWGINKRLSWWNWFLILGGGIMIYISMFLIWKNIETEF